MKVGPALIEKEPEHQMWRVSLTLQHMSYFTRWYSSHLHTKKEALEKFLFETQADLWGKNVINVSAGKLTTVHQLNELFEQIRTALIFLEAQE